MWLKKNKKQKNNKTSLPTEDSKDQFTGFDLMVHTNLPDSFLIECWHRRQLVMYRNQTSGSFSPDMFGKCQNQKQGCFRALLCQRLLTGQDNLKKYILTYLKTQKSLIQQT